jgi:hypothetical protein
MGGESFDTDHTYTAGNTQQTTGPQPPKKRRMYKIFASIASLFDPSGKTQKKLDAKRYNSSM